MVWRAAGCLAVVGLLLPSAIAGDPRAARLVSAVPLSPCYEADHARPVLTGLTVSPAVLHGVRRGAPSTVQVTATALDRGGPGPASGIADIRVFAEGGGTIQDVHLQPVGQDTYQGTLHLLGAPSGQRSLSVTVADVAGNGNDLDYLPADLRALGFASGFEVTSLHRDVTPPKVVALRISPRTIDLRRRGQTVRVRLTARDDYTGVASAVLKIGANVDTITELRRRPGQRGAWTGRLRLPRGGFVGLARTSALHVTLQDGAENSGDYGPRALRSAGLPGQVPVLAEPDRTPPAIRLVSITPQVIDTRSGPVRARIVVRGRDRGTGIRGFSVIADGVALVTDFPFFRLPGPRLRLVSGTRRDGRWAGTVTVTSCRVRNGLRQVRIAAFDSYQSSQLTTRVRFAAPDNVAPRLADLRPGSLAGPVVLTFTEDVTGADAATLPLVDDDVRSAPVTVPSPVAGTLTCATVAAVVVDCAGGAFRTATFVPAAPLLPRTSYSFHINGDGQLGLTDLSGNPLDGLDGRAVASFVTAPG